MRVAVDRVSCPLTARRGRVHACLFRCRIYGVCLWQIFWAFQSFVPGCALQHYKDTSRFFFSFDICDFLYTALYCLYRTVSGRNVLFVRTVT